MVRVGREIDAGRATQHRAGGASTAARGAQLLSSAGHGASPAMGWIGQQIHTALAALSLGWGAARRAHSRRADVIGRAGGGATAAMGSI